MEILANQIKAANHLEPVNILIVDDYQENIHALRALIESDEVNIHGFTEVDSALEALIEDDFALAILDVQMPDMSGLELAKLIRGINRYSHLPIIFVTAAYNNDQTIRLAYESGAVDFLYKPLSPQIVRSKVHVFVELYQQRRLQERQFKELEKLKIASEAANVAKSLFLANMSHEIRTPLASVMGFADLIAKGEVPLQELDNCAETIQRNGKLLLRLIDDILDLSKIEANKLELEKSDVDLNEFLKDIESSMIFKAKEKAITLSLTKPKEIEYIHHFDPIRVKQILSNIIGNAIKFTSKGRVKVETYLEEKSSKEDIFKVVVTDQGIGIDPECVKNLFQPFSQASCQVKHSFGGTGLGLAISQQLAQSMGGNIQIISSKVGAGSVFEVVIPLMRSSSNNNFFGKNEARLLPKKERDLISLSGKSILIADDVNDNLVLLEIYLRNTGSILKFAHNGREVVDICKKEKFDLILMDIQMPQMDGHEATRKLRKMKISTPIVALTALANRIEMEKCIKSGCNYTVTKPVTQTNLMKTLDLVLRN